MPATIDASAFGPVIQLNKTASSALTISSASEGSFAPDLAQSDRSGAGQSFAAVLQQTKQKPAPAAQRPKTQTNKTTTLRKPQAKAKADKPDVETEPTADGSAPQPDETAGATDKDLVDQTAKAQDTVDAAPAAAAGVRDKSGAAKSDAPPTTSLKAGKPPKPAGKDAAAKATGPAPKQAAAITPNLKKLAPASADANAALQSAVISDAHATSGDEAPPEGASDDAALLDAKTTAVDAKTNIPQIQAPSAQDAANVKPVQAAGANGPEHPVADASLDDDGVDSPADPSQANDTVSAKPVVTVAAAPIPTTAPLAMPTGVKAAIQPGPTQPSASSSAASAASDSDAAFATSNHPSIVTGLHGQLLPDGGTMHIRLDPPELGDMQVTVHVADGVVSASFQTSNEQATRLLSHSLGQLKAALESSGVSVQKLQVAQTPRSTSHQGGDPTKNEQRADDDPARREKQRRELLQKMWKRLSGSDPLDTLG